MKTTYIIFAMVGLSFSTSGIAQSNAKSSTTNQASAVNAIASVELKSGPLADFYELVAQHQPPKYSQEHASTTSQNSKNLPPPKMVFELAENMKAEQKTKP
nr:hypothetical protein [uncultured Undibacterium sp.]